MSFSKNDLPKSLKFRIAEWMTPYNRHRIWMSLFGVTVCGIGVGFLKVSELGVDPFQSLICGLDRALPIDYGLLYILVNLLLLTFSLAFNRRNIGIGTFINLFLVGYVVDFSHHLLGRWIVSPTLPVRFLCLAAGILIICLASAFYMTAGLGVSTYDAIPITMADPWKWGKFKYMRISTDLLCVLLGAVLHFVGGGTWRELFTVVGAGTVITALFLGPLVSFFNRTVAEPFLNRGMK